MQTTNFPEQTQHKCCFNIKRLLILSGYLVFLCFVNLKTIHINMYMEREREQNSISFKSRPNNLHTHTVQLHLIVTLSSVTQTHSSGDSQQTSSALIDTFQLWHSVRKPPAHFLSLPLCAHVFSKPAAPGSAALGNQKTCSCFWCLNKSGRGRPPQTEVSGLVFLLECVYLEVCRYFRMANEWQTLVFYLTLNLSL